MSTKTETGMDEGWSQDSQTMVFEIRLDSSPHKIFESLLFSTSVIFKAFLMNISQSNLIHVFQSSWQNLLTLPKLVLDLKSVNSERRYWHFSETRYTPVVILEGFFKTIDKVQSNDGFFKGPLSYHKYMIFKIFH